MREVVIPYKPRPIWLDTLHPALEKHRFAVLVCHRRFGKTVGTVNHMIKQGIINTREAPRYAYLAPYLKQAKMIAWEYLKHYTSVIPGATPNESSLYVELPTLHSGWPGTRFYIIGGDHPDALRGGYWDGVILDEYAKIKPSLWGEVVRPALSDRQGWAVFIGTPKGQNQFYEMYQFAQREKTWFSCLYRSDETNVLPDEEIEEMRATMTEMEFRQELLCDFSASASDVVIPIDLVSGSAARELLPGSVDGQPVVIGVDVARFGDDRTVITVRQGLWCREQRVYSGLDTMATAERVIVAIKDFHPAATFIDAGAMGAGVIDRLRQLRYNVSEVNFGGGAMDGERYANIRAEMYFNAKAWMESGGAIPNDPKLKTELSVVEYKFNQAGKIILEPKDKLKERTGWSPDLADSFVLTFARPVHVARDERFDEPAEEYDPLADM